MAVEGGYLTELLTEKDNLDPSFVHSMRLLTEGRSWIVFQIIALQRHEKLMHEDSNICIPSRSLTTSCF